MSTDTQHATQQAQTVSVEMAARLLGISRGYAFQLAARGELPGAIRLGRRIVVSRRVLERVLSGDPNRRS